MAQQARDQQHLFLSPDSYNFIPNTNPMAQTAILDSHEQGFMENFFNNPEQAMTQQGISEEASFGANGLYNPFNFLSEASLPANSAQWQYPANDVQNAASALTGFQTVTNGQTGNPDYSNTWGNMASTNAGSSLSQGFQGAQAPGPQSTNGIFTYPFPTSHFQAPPTWQHSMQGAQAFPQQQGAPHRARHLSLDTTQQGFHVDGQASLSQQEIRSAAPDLQTRPANVRFGSDNNFSDNGYQAPTNYKVQMQDRSSDLLGIPFAAQAASPTSTTTPNRVPNGSAGQRHGFSAVSHANDLGGLPTPTSAHQGGSSWARQAGDTTTRDDLQDQHPRKRRKGRAEDDDEETSNPTNGKVRKAKNENPDDDLVPASTNSKKRRKSTQARQGASSPQSPASSAGGDDEDEPASSKKKEKKPRQNLSDVQKRQNHIMSEKKRRELIKTGYADLNELVPALVGGRTGLSRSESLFECQTYLEGLIDGSKLVMQALGVTEEDLAIPTNFGQDNSLVEAGYAG